MGAIYCPKCGADAPDTGGQHTSTTTNYECAGCGATWAVRDYDG